MQFFLRERKGSAARRCRHKEGKLLLLSCFPCQRRQLLSLPLLLLQERGPLAILLPFTQSPVKVPVNYVQSKFQSIITTCPATPKPKRIHESLAQKTLDGRMRKRERERGERRRGGVHQVEERKGRDRGASVAQAGRAAKEAQRSQKIHLGGACGPRAHNVVESGGFLEKTAATGQRIGNVQAQQM